MHIIINEHHYSIDRGVSPHFLLLRSIFWLCVATFFLERRENHRITPPAQGSEKDNVGLLLIKTPRVPSAASVPRNTVSRLTGSRGLGRQLGRYRTPSISVLLLKMEN